MDELSYDLTLRSGELRDVDRHSLSFLQMVTPDRFSRKNFDQYQLPDLGKWLIHGHTHSDERRSGKRSICVSLEAWDLRPASAEGITAEMQLR